MLSATLLYQRLFRNELQGHSGPFQKEVMQLLGKFSS